MAKEITTLKELELDTLFLRLGPDFKTRFEKLPDDARDLFLQFWKQAEREIIILERQRARDFPFGGPNY